VIVGLFSLLGTGCAQQAEESQDSTHAMLQGVGSCGKPAGDKKRGRKGISSDKQKRHSGIRRNQAFKEWC